MKTPKKCGRKTCRSRQAPGLMRRGIVQCIIKNQVSCRNGKTSQKVWQWPDRQWTRVSPRFTQDLQGTQVKWCMEYTSRSLEIVLKKTLCQRWSSCWGIKGTWGRMWGKWRRWLANRDARWRCDWWYWGSEFRWWLMTHLVPEIDKGKVAKEGLQGEQGEIFMR